MELKIISVNISEKKGTVKKPTDRITVTNLGVQGDAHSGNWHRQISLLGTESVARFALEAGRHIAFGEFAENLTTEGIELVNTLPLDRFSGHGVELEITQIGKKCHGTSCAIFTEVGNCVMPKEGIFARVKKAGELKPGDKLTYEPRIFQFRIITLSDRASRGEYSDRSGPRITEMISAHFANTKRKFETQNILIADNAEQLRLLIGKAIAEGVDVVFTTGGTGIGERDITVDTVKPLLHMEIPGIMDSIRMKFGANNPLALLSRSVAGIAGNTFIYTLPGSVKAINEYMPEIMKTLEHLIYMRHGLDTH